MDGCGLDITKAITKCQDALQNNEENSNFTAAVCSLKCHYDCSEWNKAAGWKTTTLS